MVYLLVPGSSNKLKFPDEDAAMEGANYHVIEHWEDLITRQIEARKGQLDMFAGNDVSIEDYEALLSISKKKLEEAYVLNLKGLAPKV